MLGGAGEASLDFRRRFLLAGCAGGAIATAVFVVFLMNGEWSLLRSEGSLSGFYDTQARSLLELRWDVPARSLSIEGFRIGSKTYMYFGPFPALLRLPVVALTDRFDGRLTQLSMLLAFMVAMVFVVRLAWRVRPLVRNGEPFTRAEAWAVGGFVLVSGVGTTLLFLSAQLTVFHEAALWSVALALGAFEAVVAVVQRPIPRRVVIAAVLATLALLTRAVVGMGPLLALGLLAAAAWLPATRRLVGLPDTVRRGPLVVGLAAAAAIPVLLYAWINYAKFGTLFSLPFEQQLATLANPQHREVLAANGGSLVGGQFVPTTVLQYLRPDAIRLDVLAPWVRFPGSAHVVGDVAFDQRNPTSSVIDSMLLPSILGVVGLVAMCRRRTRAALAALRAPVVGAALSTLGVLTFGFIAQRYLADFVPLVIVLSAAGLYVAVGRITGRATRVAARRVLWAGGIVLAVVSVWWSVGLTAYHQQAITADTTRLANFVRWQYDVHAVVPGGSPPHLVRRDSLPQPLGTGTVAVVGDCDGVYWSTGSAWKALERTPETGAFSLRVRFPRDATPGTRQTLIETGSPRNGQRVSVVYRSPRRAVVEYQSEPGTQRFASRSFAITPGRTQTMAVSFDPVSGQVLVGLDGRGLIAAGVFGSRHLVRPLHPVAVGRASTMDPPAAAFAGTIDLAQRRVPLCRQLVS